MDRLIERGEIQFAVTIPGDFTRRVVRHDNPQILVEADASDPAATGGAVAALAQLPQYALAHDLKGPIATPPATGPPSPARSATPAATPAAPPPCTPSGT